MAAPRALLLQPRDIRWFWGWSPPPLGYLYLAASAPGTVIRDCAQEGSDECAVIDEVGAPVVGVTAFTSTRFAALRALEHAHARGATTVLGGPHVWYRRIAEQVIEHYPFVDYVVRGDGEQAWRRIVEGDTKGMERIVTDYLDDLDSLPVPAWDAVPVMSYPPRDEGHIVGGVDLGCTPRVSVVFSRGCPGACNFCAAWRRPLRRHSPSWIREALAPLAALGVRHLCLDDDCWATNEEEAKEIAAILGGYGFCWSAETRADLLTPELAEAMAAGGCWQVAVGLEHGSQRMLDGPIGKRLRLDDVLTARAAAWDAGLRFVALFLSGYPGETDEDRAAHAAFLRLLAPDGTGTLGRTLILPGTQLWLDAVAAEKVDESIWLDRSVRHLLARTDGGVEAWG